MTGLFCGTHQFEASSYSVTKWAVVSYTRHFKACEENPWNKYSIKGYALCPWFVDTNLIHGAMENAVEEIEKIYKRRVLKVEEVGDSFDQALDLDNNGAIYGIVHDLPTLLFPDWNYTFKKRIFGYAKIRQMLSFSTRKLVDVQDLLKIAEFFSFCAGFTFACILFALIKNIG